MWPPLFLSGALWFGLQAINALGVFFVSRTDSDAPALHVAMALWLVSFLLWTLWAIPWEMELPVWTLFAWALATLVSIGAVVAAFLAQSTIGAALLTVYTGILSLIVVINLLLMCSSPTLGTRFTDPFEVYFHNNGWPIREIFADGQWRAV